jgi:hypothetical protein
MYQTTIEYRGSGFYCNRPNRVIQGGIPRPTVYSDQIRDAYDIVFRPISPDEIHGEKKHVSKKQK